MAHLERFAPSPTGPLHLGHAFSALTAWQAAQASHGRFLLRIEDIDQSRCRPAWEAQIYDDLAWLGIVWEVPVLRQSENLTAYNMALESLSARGLIYACKCSRSQIRAASTRPALGPDGLVYPGTCKPGNLPATSLSAQRLNMEKAINALGGEKPVNKLTFMDNGKLHRLSAKALIETCGDIVLARPEMGTSYHLSVVVDDAAQGITNVTRGQDLFDATPIHRLLQALLGLPSPSYHHHRLICDEHGKRLAKTDKSRAIAKYRAEGATPTDIRRLVNL